WQRTEADARTAVMDRAGPSVMRHQVPVLLLRAVLPRFAEGLASVKMGTGTVLPVGSTWRRLKMTLTVSDLSACPITRITLARRVWGVLSVQLGHFSGY